MAILGGLSRLMPLLLIIAWTALVKSLFPQIELINLAMIYLLLNVLIALRYDQATALICSLLSVASFNFFFVPPFYTFAVHEEKYWVTFLTMFTVTILTARLTIRLRRSAQEATERERDTAKLYAMSQELLKSQGLKEIAERNAEKERLISTLLSSVSHDFRTPLTVLSGAAATLSNTDVKLTDTDRNRLLATISDEVIHLNRLVGNILQITKIESGNIPIHKELHSLEEIIGSALNRVESVLGERPVDIDIPDDFPLVPLDDVLIQQVLTNLLENAVRYSPAGTPITITASSNAQEAHIEITDRGSGIRPQDQERIFERFYRSNATGTQTGTGLGLAICQGIIKLHHGTIGVKDRDGGGSIFSIALPLASGATLKTGSL
jgi:K+-sensing histidine kinase KdpD